MRNFSPCRKTAISFGSVPFTAAMSRQAIVPSVIAFWKRPVKRCEEIPLFASGTCPGHPAEETPDPGKTADYRLLPAPFACLLFQKICVFYRSVNPPGTLTARLKRSYEKGKRYFHASPPAGQPGPVVRVYRDSSRLRRSSPPFHVDTEKARHYTRHVKARGYREIVPPLGAGGKKRTFYGERRKGDENREAFG